MDMRRVQRGQVLMERICIRRVAVVIYWGRRVVSTIDMMKNTIKSRVPESRVGVRVNQGGLSIPVGRVVVGAAKLKAIMRREI